MSTPILLPKLGNTVETCIIETWHKQIGDQVEVGEILCDVETDKATLEVESTAAGTLLALHFSEGDEVEVLATIATIGQPGEEAPLTQSSIADPQPQPPSQAEALLSRPISPRARKLASQHQVDVTALNGSGPNGRIIERDIQAILGSTAQKAPDLSTQSEMTPVARRMVQSGQFNAPQQGSGPKGRIMRRDLGEASDKEIVSQSEKKTGEVEVEKRDSRQATDEVTVVPVKGARRVIAKRMLNSVQTTAPFTLHRHADARALKAYRQRLKSSPPELGLNNVTLNDLVLFAAVGTLVQHPELNAHFHGSEIHQFSNIDLGFAVDTPRGLLVPVIRQAQIHTLQTLSNQVKRLVDECIAGRVNPDELSGGTFTLSNLGSLGIETFTPVLNPPQVGILGVGNITLKPVEVSQPHADEPTISFIPHIGLSLTVDHQAVDGAPAAHFLETLANNLANIDLLTAI